MSRCRSLIHPFLTAASLVLILSANLSAVPRVGLDRRTRGVDRPILIHSRAALEMAAHADGLVVRQHNQTGTLYDLILFYGPNYAQSLVLLNNAPVHALGAHVYTALGYLIFSFIYNTQLYLGVVHNPAQASPQGPSPLFMVPVTFEEGFSSSDVHVTDDGEILVLGYLADGQTYQPRLYYSAGIGAEPQGVAPFQPVPLGLQGIYLGGIYGSPRMRIVPALLADPAAGPAGSSGRKVYLWATKQFTEAESQIALIEVDLDAALSAPAEETSGITGFATEIIIGLIAAVLLQERNNYIETTVGILGTPECPVLAFFFMDDHWRLRAAFFDLKSRQARIIIVDSLNFRTETFVKLGAACGLLGNKYRCTINAGSKLFNAWGGGNVVANTGAALGGEAAPAGSQSPAYGGYGYGWPRVREAPVRIRSNDNFGCLFNYCFPGFSTYTPWLFFFGNFLPKEPVQSGPAGAAEEPSFGFRPLYLGQSVDVPQIVQGEGLTSITVSNPNDTAQQFEYYLSGQDGTEFQGGTGLLEPNQTLTIQVEGTAPNPGAATILSPLGVTVQSLTDLSSIVDTPVFGAPGVEASEGWSLPFVTPAGSLPGATSPSGGGGNRETGVAIHNIENVENTCTFTAYSASGELDSSVEVPFGAGEQAALFVTQLLPDLGSTSGLISIDCDGPVSVVGAIQEQSGAIVLTPANPD